MKSVRLPFLLALVVMTSGCENNSGVTSSEGSRPSVNMQEAAQRADFIIKQTLSDIRPTLRWNHGPSIDRMCSEQKNGSMEIGSVRRRIALLTIVSRERRGSLLGVVERSWKDRGYEITNVDPDKDLPAIYAKSPEEYE